MDDVRQGRSGLKIGTGAPVLTLPGVGGAAVSRSDFIGSQVFFAFTPTGCAPCHATVPKCSAENHGVTPCAAGQDDVVGKTGAPAFLSSTKELEHV